MSFVRDAFFGERQQFSLAMERFGAGMDEHKGTVRLSPLRRYFPTRPSEYDGGMKRKRS
jgi:hypothetical protein